MMNSISNIPFILCIFCLGCGTDPILEKAQETEIIEEKIVQSSASETKIKNDELPNIAPPKTGTDIEQIALPKIAPPPEQGQPQKGEPLPPQPPKEEMVEFTGTIQVKNWSGKAIRMDIFDGDQRKIGGQRPSVVVSETFTAIGAFSIQLPKSDKYVWIGAYIDEDQDGRPGPKDPSGWYVANPLSTQTPQKGIVLELSIPQDNPPK